MNQKFTISKMKSWFNSIIAVLAVISVSTSCSSEKDINEGGGNLQINLKGIEEYVDADKIGKLASANGLPKDAPVEIQSLNEFDVITNVGIQEVISGNSNEKLASITAPKDGAKIASTTALSNNVKYVIAFYNKADNSLVGTPYEIMGLSQPAIQLPLGEYKWAAYSLNADTIPSFTNNIINAKDIANKDFIYSNGEITISTGFNYLDLRFHRMTSQFEVTLDARGMFGVIDDNTKVKLFNSANEEYLKTKNASFNILTGEFDTPSTTDIELESTRWENVTTDSSVRKISFFVLANHVNQIPANSLKLDLSPLKLGFGVDNFVVGYDKKLVDGVSVDDLDKPIVERRKFERTFNNALVSLIHSSLDNIKGFKFKVDAKVVESAIQVGTSSTQWARSNLYYDERAIDKYRFRESPHFRDIPNGSAGGYLQDNNDLWRFNTSTPNSDDQTGGFDPCTQVYPSNLWKLASDADFNNLPAPDEVGVIDRGEPLVWILASFKPYEMVATWRNKNTSTTTDGYNTLYRPVDDKSNSHDLHLPGVGYKNVLNTIIERPTASAVLNLGIAEVLPIFSGGGYYWTSKGITATGKLRKPTYYTYNVNNGGLLGVGIPSLLKLTLLNIQGKFSNETDNGMLTGSLSFGNDNWEARMNIRCVRNANYPAAPTYN